MTQARNQDVFKQFERDSYSKIASGYADKTALVSSQTNESILSALQVRPGSRFLDVACGPGLLTRAAIEHGARAASLDFAPKMVALARSSCPEADVREGDAENLPFEGDFFDAVACSLGLLHFPNPERAVAEAFRVLKSGGRYAFTCWTPPAANPFMGLIIGSIQAHGTLDVDLPAGPPLFRFGEVEECENILKEAGFGGISVTECSLEWPSESPESLLQELPSSTGRLGPLLDLQTPGDREKIEAAIVAAARAYQTSDGVRIPSSVLIASGMKP